MSSLPLIKKQEENAQVLDARVLRMRIPSVWLIAGGGWVGRGVQVVAQLVAVRILIDHLGTGGYGAFAVLASVNGWLLLSDLCLGISVQNYISERRAVGSEVDDIIITGASLSLIVAIGWAIILFATGPWLGEALLGEFDGLSSSDRTTAIYALAFPAIGTALGSVVYKIWFAWHRGYLSNLLPAAGTVIGTACIWLMSGSRGAGNVATATLFYYAPLAILPLLALAATVLRSSQKNRFRRDLVRPLLSRGFRFWVSGLLAAAVLQVDYFIMVRILPVHDIVIYNIASKIFLLIFFVYNALIFALWPVCSEAIARNDWARVLTIARKYIAFGVCFSVVAGCSVAFVNPWIVDVLAPDLGTPIPLIVVVMLTLYTGLRVWTDTYGMILQSMNDLIVMWLVAPIQALLSIGMQIVGAHWFGLPGVVGGLIGCFLLTAAWVLPLRCYMHAKRALPHE